MNLIRKNLYRNLQVILCHSIKLEASIANMHSGGLAAPVLISDSFHECRKEKTEPQQI
jgi:hypothetical protein